MPLVFDQPETKSKLVFDEPTAQVPSYDPMGMPTGTTEAAPPAPTMSYAEQMKRMGQFAKGYPKGAIGALVGTPGDIEQLGRAGVNLAARKLGYDQAVAPTPALPTSESIQERLFGRPASKAEELGRTFGEVIGVPTLASVTKPLLKKGAKEVLGAATRTTENIAKEAEKMGFKLEPRQLRAEKPLGTPGFAGNAEKNQKLANELVTDIAGKKADAITPQYVAERLKEAGDAYNEIFDQYLFIDKDLVTRMGEIANFERRVAPAGMPTAGRTADTVMRQYAVSAGSLGGDAAYVYGRDLQRLRSDMSRIARTATDGNDRFTAGKFVEEIDNAISRNNEKLGEKLAQTNRKYAVAKTLEDMIAENKIRQGNISLDQLGDYVAKNVYGYGSGTARHPLTNLGYMGRELGLRALWEGVQEPGGELAKVLSKAGRLVAPLSRTQAARRVQRGLSEGPSYVPGAPSLAISGVQAIDETQGR